MYFSLRYLPHRKVVENVRVWEARKSDPRGRHSGIHGFALDNIASCTWRRVDRDLIYLRTECGCA